MHRTVPKPCLWTSHKNLSSFHRMAESWCQRRSGYINDRPLWAFDTELALACWPTLTLWGALPTQLLLGPDLLCRTCFFFLPLIKLSYQFKKKSIFTRNLKITSVIFGRLKYALFQITELKVRRICLWKHCSTVLHSHALHNGNSSVIPGHIYTYTGMGSLTW